MTEQPIMNKMICNIAYKTNSTLIDMVFNPRSKTMLIFGLLFILFPISETNNFNFDYSLKTLICIFSFLIGISIMLSFAFNKITVFDLITKNKPVGFLSISILLILLINMLILIYNKHGINYLISIWVFIIICMLFAITFAHGLNYILSKCSKHNNKIV